MSFRAGCVAGATNGREAVFVDQVCRDNIRAEVCIRPFERAPVSILSYVRFLYKKYFNPILPLVAAVVF